MGFLGHYKQFEEMSDDEVRAMLHERSERRRSAELLRIERFDLSSSTWPELPHPEVVGAVTYAARGSLNRYAAPEAGELRALIAARERVHVEQVVVGQGAAALLEAAVCELTGPDRPLLMQWPSYELYPLLATRAGAEAVAVQCDDLDSVAAAQSPPPGALVLANPDDPTGELRTLDQLAAIANTLPAETALLIDEALIEFAGHPAPLSATNLFEQHPNTVVFRTFSKAWGLAGLRCGYAISSAQPPLELARLLPPLGVDALAQAGALAALEHAPEQVNTRAALVAAERTRLMHELHTLPLDVAASNSNLLWMRAGALTGDQLAAKLHAAGVDVMPGSRIGAPDRVRAAVQLPEANDRLLEALAKAVTQ